MPDMEKEIYTLLGQASHFMTKDKARKIKPTLKANPNARKSINIPELKVLVLREEARLEEKAELIARLGVKVIPTEDLKTRRICCRLNMEYDQKRGVRMV